MLKNVALLDVTPRGTCKNRSFGRTYRLHLQGKEDQRAVNWESLNQQMKDATRLYCACEEGSNRTGCRSEGGGRAVGLGANAEVHTRHTILWRAFRGKLNGQTTNKQNKNSVALSPRANYTDCATAICWQNLVPTFVDRAVSRGQSGGSPTVVNFSFLDRSRYFSFK
jgi:hypothetical protein